LLHALYTGIAASPAIERALSGQPDAFDEYAATVVDLAAAYERVWRFGYARETRFPESVFWQRRQAAGRYHLLGDRSG
jgi:hypothetical protein